MLKPISSLIDFNSQKKFEFRTGKYWIHESLLEEIRNWAIMVDIRGIYVANGVTELACAFAFRTEEELGIFNLAFYEKIIADQVTTRYYKLFGLVRDLDSRSR